MKKIITSLILLLSLTLIIPGIFAYQESLESNAVFVEPVNEGLWYEEGTIDNKFAYVLHSKIKHLWGYEVTGTFGVSDIGDWSIFYPSDALETTLEIDIPDNQFSTVVIERANVNLTGITKVTEQVITGLKIAVEPMGVIKIYDANNNQLLSMNSEVALRIYFKATLITPEPEQYITVADLPITGNNTLGNVYFSVSGTEVIVTIWYSGQPYYLKYNLHAQTDMTIFNKAEAYFINVNKPQIYINQSNNLYLRDMLEASSDSKPAFVPHVIWDLESNELTSTQKYNAYAYVKQNNEGVLIAYYYVDSFIMDNIISTTLTYTSRRHMTNFFGLVNERTEWETKMWSHTNESELSYRNLTADWQLLIPIYNIVFSNIKLNTYYQMPAIQALDFNDLDPKYNITKLELETEYASVSNSFTTLKNNPRYKVWAFALEEGRDVNVPLLGSVQTEFYNNKENPDDPRNLKVLEIVYQTDAKLYTTVGQDMNLVISVEPQIDGIANEEKGISSVFFGIIAAVAVLVFGLIQGKLMTRKGLNISYILGAIFLGLIVYIVIANWAYITTLIVYRL